MGKISDLLRRRSVPDETELSFEVDLSRANGGRALLPLPGDDVSVVEELSYIESSCEKIVSESFGWEWRDKRGTSEEWYTDGVYEISDSVHRTKYYFDTEDTLVRREEYIGWDLCKEEMFFYGSGVVKIIALEKGMTSPVIETVTTKSLEDTLYGVPSWIDGNWVLLSICDVCCRIMPSGSPDPTWEKDESEEYDQYSGLSFIHVSYRDEDDVCRREETWIEDEDGNPSIMIYEFCADTCGHQWHKRVNLGGIKAEMYSPVE